MNQDQIKSLLAEHFTESEVSVQGSDGRFELRIVADDFIGLSRVARQQAVYKVLNPYIQSGAIHAVSIQAVSCDEWHKIAPDG